MPSHDSPTLPFLTLAQVNESEPSPEQKCLDCAGDGVLPVFNQRGEQCGAVPCFTCGGTRYVPPVVEDVDAFDAGDFSIYAVSEAELIEEEFRCDCGNDIFVHNQCTDCGAVAPWAARLGCGLA